MHSIALCKAFLMICLDFDSEMGQFLPTNEWPMLQRDFFAIFKHYPYVLIFVGQVHCLGDIVHPGALLSVTNLTYRGIDHTHNIPTATMKEVTLFSQRPTNQYLVTALDQLRTSLPVSCKKYLASN